jgi:transposase-like protein
MAQARTRRRFTAEYKSEAVKRLEESGKSLQQGIRPARAALHVSA